MVNVLARSPGNLIEVIVSQDYLFDEFYSLKQIREPRSCLVMTGYEVEVPPSCWS